MQQKILLATFPANVLIVLLNFHHSEIYLYGEYEELLYKNNTPSLSC